MYDATPHIKQLMRTIQNLKAQNESLEDQLLLVQVENEELETRAATLQQRYDNQTETLESLQAENAELQYRVALSPMPEALSPCQSQK